MNNQKDSNLTYLQVPESQFYFDLIAPRVTDNPDSIRKSSRIHTMHVAVICTEWDEFVSLDYQKIYDSMAKPAYLFDGRKIVDHEKLIGMGFHVVTIGRKLQRTGNQQNVWTYPAIT